MRLFDGVRGQVFVAAVLAAGALLFVYAPRFAGDASAQQQGQVVTQGKGGTYGPWWVSGAGGVPVPVAPGATSTANVFNVSGRTGTTQMAGLSGAGLSYYVSGFICSANSAITCGLSSSSTAGNDCATAPTVLIGPHYIPANGGYAPPIPASDWIKAPANSTLCCTPSAGIATCTVIVHIAP